MGQHNKILISQVKTVLLNKVESHFFFKKKKMHGDDIFSFNDDNKC